ncbi:MAG: 16S rRNA (cytidine(1402)-2'-O)-methyltransferase [candidate division Zixibacteria bacterium]|nr:16S rRNA (cytidine(1402)-2'-O)-methyltransferase [candidate division Zixibacteria bacterium]
MNSCGTLYLVATPIGNLDDITYRAVKVLAGVDFIACEDTRKSGILLKHLGIRKPLLSYRDFNERRVAERIIKRIMTGEDGAVICDAGTPAISDPGFVVARQAIAEGVKLVAIPGATALAAALSVSGLPTDSFIFLGFLPPRAGKRKAILASVADRRETLIFYESPHRLHRLLDELVAVLGNRQAALCRELTKKFEEIIRLDIEKMREQLEGRKLKGEITLVVEGNVRRRKFSDTVDE